MNTENSQNEAKQAVPGETNSNNDVKVHRIVIEAMGPKQTPEEQYLEQLLQRFDKFIGSKIGSLSDPELALLATIRRQLASYEGYEELEIQRWQCHHAAMQNHQTIVEMHNRFRIETDNYREQVTALKKEHEAHVKLLEKQWRVEIEKDVQASEQERQATEKMIRSNRALRALIKRLKKGIK